MTTFTKPKTVPLLPGFQFSDPEKINHRKTQQFSYKDHPGNKINKVCEKTNFLREDLDPILLDALRTSAPANF